MFYVTVVNLYCHSNFGSTEVAIPDNGLFLSGNRRELLWTLLLVWRGPGSYTLSRSLNAWTVIFWEEISVTCANEIKLKIASLTGLLLLPTSAKASLFADDICRHNVSDCRRHKSRGTIWAQHEKSNVHTVGALSLSASFLMIFISFNSFGVGCRRGFHSRLNRKHRSW